MSGSGFGDREGRWGKGGHLARGPALAGGMLLDVGLQAPDPVVHGREGGGSFRHSAHLYHVDG